MENPSLPVEGRLMEALFNEKRNDQRPSTDNALANQESHVSRSPESIQTYTSEMVMPTILTSQASSPYYTESIHSTTPSMTYPHANGYDSNPFQTMIDDISEIRANTQVPPFGLGPVPTPLGPRPESAPRSPIRENPLFTPSPKMYKSPFQETEPPLSTEYLLLRDFVDDLPTESPTPFNSALFVESPEQKRKWVERPVTMREYDENGRFIKMPVEMALVYEEPPKHRAHCVLCSSRDFHRGQHSDRALLSIWTRKYPAGWQGIYKKGGELVNFDERRRDIDWMYSVAAVLDIQGVETSVECKVFKNVTRFNELSYDADPTWEDVLHVLREEFSGRTHRRLAVQPQPLPQQPSSLQPSSQQTISSQVLPQAPKQPKNSSQKAPKTPKKSKNKYVLEPAQPAQPVQPAQPKPLQNAPKTMEKSSSCVVSNCQSCSHSMMSPSSNKIPGMVPQHQELAKSGNQQYFSSLKDSTEFEAPYHGHSQEINISTEAVEVGGFEKTNVPTQVPPTARQAHPGDAMCASAIEEARQDLSPVPEQQKPKRKRAPAKKKQTTPEEDVQEDSGQAEKAKVAQTPPSTAKSGRKRKGSTTTPTPAQNTTTAGKSANKTPKAKTHAAKTSSVDMPATKTPAQKRVRSSKKTSQSSDVQREGSEEGQVEGNMPDNLPEQLAQFGSSPYSSPTGFKTQQMELNGPVHNQHQQMGQNQRAQDDELTANIISQTQMPTSAWNNQQGPGSFHPSAGPSAIPPYIQDIWNRILMIDAEIRFHLNNCPLVSDNPEVWRGIQSRIDMLGRQRAGWSSMVANYPYPTYPSPTWDSGLPSNVGMFSMEPNNSQLQQNNQMFSVQQNDDFHPAHSQTPVPHDYSAEHQHFIHTSFNQPEISDTLQDTQATEGYAAPSPAQITLAEWPQEDVERARSSVESTLGRPSGPSFSEY
ncbi:hypothetical protein N431DRAFT_422921 [Stipitochalara longipes BDJ]|nr:hypothetical protein N431DRAFT_422921 [Stipitochalara longipes BDJ]